MSPISVLSEKIDEYEHWKDIVCEGNTANLENMTFLEFMAKLDRLIDKYEKEAQAAKERADSIKNKHYGSRK